MAKKSADVVHEMFRTSFWSGRAIAWCGATYEQGNWKVGGMFTSANCPGCKAAKKSKSKPR